MMRGRKALLIAAVLAILVWPLLAAPPSEPLAASLQSGSTTTRVSVHSDGTEGDGYSIVPSISADGRYVAFCSAATNLVTGDDNDTEDVFVHDRETDLTERVSVDSLGNEGNSSSCWPSISADGRYVAFESNATNLVTNDTSSMSDIFVHDRETDLTELVSVDSLGNEGDGFSRWPSISADGRYVAFESESSNLVTDDTNNTCDTNFDGVYEENCPDVFIHDRETDLTERVSVDSLGNEGNEASRWPSISADGRYVAFYSYATNLVTDDTNNTCDTNLDGVYEENCPDVFIHDRETGQTERVSVRSDGTQGDGTSRWPSISADGRYVAFYSYATNLVPGDTNGLGDVFVHDRETDLTERVSVRSDGTQGNSASNLPSISADGRYVAFESWATNLVTGDTNDTSDIFVHDRETSQTTRVSLRSDGTEGNSISSYASISADGGYVAFQSEASNLVPDDTNGTEDIFVHDQLPNKVYVPLILKNY